MNSLVLVDTSSWIQALRIKGNRDVKDRVDHLLVQEQAAWCDIIKLELWTGARGDQEKARLRALNQVVTRLALSDDTWDLSIQLAAKAQDRGYHFPPNDFLIAACAHVHGMRIEHVDRHYDSFHNILRE